MRTKALFAAATMLAAGFATSLAQSNVYSLNVVGYVNKTLPGPSTYSLIANPLNTSSNTLGGILTASLPLGSQVLKFNPVTVGYDVYTRVAFGTGWSPPAGATASFAPGEGAFVLTPGTGGNITNTFVGEVLQGNLTNDFPAGYKLAGNMVPDTGNATTLGLTPVVPNGSQLLKLNATGAGYDIYTRVAFGVFWSGPGGQVVPTIDVAEGFFLNNSGSATNWVRNFTVQ